MLATAAAVLLPLGEAGAGEAFTVVNPASAYPEGPLADGDGVFYAEMGADRVLRWEGQGNQVVWSRRGCGPTSVARGNGDTLVVLCHRQNAVAIVGRDGTTRRMIDRDDAGRPFMTPNASMNDGRGGVYFSSSGTFSPDAPATGGVLYLDSAGHLTRVADGIHYANGVALTSDGRTLFVCEHLERRILAYDVAADGTLSNRRVFLALDDVVAKDPGRGWEAGPDGLALDGAGHLAIAEYGGGRLIIVGMDARLRSVIPFPEKYTTAATFIEGGRRIFVTAPVSLYDAKAYGKVYVVDSPVFGTN